MPTECKHCEASGTCKNGLDGSACAACHAMHLLKGLASDAPTNGLPCGICKGTGIAELFTEKLQNRIVPFISLFIITVTLALVFYLAYGASQQQSEALTLAGTLVGSVTGYYFGGKGKNT
ncbi:hypothetical protein [Pseudomonas chlororaphis]|uniref:hypothetical protein n=1 Tax=Pseudomonas chlororaphis TaxID=587753 RepID=UPI001B3119F8|nr:hypothetical protein [Pseudomonas chlororaphis]QTT91440.1 molecular chaperone DnaJ [Pseudomonas chlororaphis]